MINNKIKFGVGILILLFFINIGVAIYYVLDQKGVFDKRYSFYFTSQSADPFVIGMPVKLSGFKIGYVDSLKLNDDGSVRINFSIDEKNRKWVMKESIIMIQKPLLGSAQIILYPAVDNPLLQEGSKLAVYENSDINDLIFKLKPIMEKVENIVISVDKITSYLAREDSELVKIVKNLEVFTSRIAQNQSMLTTITGDENSTKSLIQTVNILPKIVQNIDNLTSNLNSEITPEVVDFLKELKEIAKDVRSKLQKLDGVVNSVGGYENDIVRIKEDINTAIVKSNEILEKVDSIFPGEKSTDVELP